MIQAYFSQLQAIVDQYAATNFVVETRVNIETRPGDQGYLTGTITFIDNSTLHFSEFLDQIGNVVDKLMYSYHYQDAENQLIFRYDNALHKPSLSSREHKHLPQQSVEATAPTLDDVLAEIVTTRRWM
jgi:hypothetical protein